MTLKNPLHMATTMRITDAMTLVFGLVFAFGFGLVATRLRLPPLIGYLLAGIAIGPFTPGFAWARPQR
jgi:predicted Kef-type K+ transport protein